MSLGPPTAREPVHHRHIESRGYRRAYDVWASKAPDRHESVPVHQQLPGEIAPGEPIHDMWLRLTLDDDLTVIKVEAATDAGPFAVCPAMPATVSGAPYGGQRRARPAGSVEARVEPEHDARSTNA